MPGLLSHFGIHVQAPAVNKWEKGETVPNAYQLLALCHALDIPEGIDYFTGPILPKKEILNTRGLRMLGNYRESLDSNGVLHPQVVLISQNKAYEPKVITPNMRFQIIGRVLN